MRTAELQEFLRDDGFLPKNEMMGFRCNRKLAVFLKGHAALSKVDPSTLVRFAVHKWAEKEGYNPTGL